eukprot:scaffold7349_cov173-Amphora_coffeaeformis.AAC.85
MRPSYTTNVIAAPGATRRAFGMHPLKKPVIPSACHMRRIVPVNPVYSRRTAWRLPSAVISKASARSDIRRWRLRNARIKNGFDKFKYKAELTLHTRLYHLQGIRRRASNNLGNGSHGQVTRRQFQSFPYRRRRRRGSMGSLVVKVLA